MESGRLRIQFQRFGAIFADRWPRWTGARLIEVHLHSKSFGGTLKWPLKGGSRLIEVTATAGLTVAVWQVMASSFICFKMFAWSTSMLLLPHITFMLSVVKMLLKGEVGSCALNSHGNYIW